jgi:hypothetical protein
MIAEDGTHIDDIRNDLPWDTTFESQIPQRARMSNPEPEGFCPCPEVGEARLLDPTGWF